MHLRGQNVKTFRPFLYIYRSSSFPYQVLGTGWASGNDADK